MHWLPRARMLGWRDLPDRRCWLDLQSRRTVPTLPTEPPELPLVSRGVCVLLSRQSLALLHCQVGTVGAVAGPGGCFFASCDGVVLCPLMARCPLLHCRRAVTLPSRLLRVRGHQAASA